MVIDQGSREVKRDGHFRHHLDEIDKENLKIGVEEGFANFDCSWSCESGHLPK